MDLKVKEKKIQNYVRNKKFWIMLLQKKNKADEKLAQ